MNTKKDDYVIFKRKTEFNLNIYEERKKEQKTK